MRKIPLLILSTIFLAACSSDSEPTNFESESESTDSKNNVPTINAKTLTIPEHSESGTSIGFVEASDIEDDELTFTIDSDADIVIIENTGELTVGTNLKLDFETDQSIPFTISVFDGKAIAEKDFNLTIEDIDETTLLTDDQKELITYFQHLAFWKGASNTPVQFNQKWGSDMMLHLEGAISTDYRATVESVIAQYNTLTVDGDFNISLVGNESDANARLFFGTKAEVEAIWPDMYDEIKDGSYAGYAMTPSQNSILVSTRIWISNPVEVLLKHELGHALGFGHSNKCEDENSFLCSQISVDNDFLPIEEEIIRLMYHADLPAGLTETEIEMVLANLMINEL